MAYISQYEIDMQQDQRNRQNQASIGNALNGIASVFAEDRKRALASKNAQDAQNLAFAKEGVGQEAIDAFNKGDKSGIAAFYADLSNAKRDQAKRDKLIADSKGESAVYEAEQLRKPLEERDSYKSTMATMDAKARHEQSAAQIKADQDAKKLASKTGGEAFEVPGYGMVRTKSEAEKIRTAKGDAETAKEYIKQLKDLGTNVAVWDRDKIGKINQLKQALVGKLRLPLMGPGTMTEDEFQRTVSNLGDPSSMFSTEKNEIGKLDQMAGILDNNINAMYSSAASNKQPGMYQVQGQPQQQPPQQVIQKIQQYTPEQKAQRLEQLRAKKAGVAMVGQ